MKLTGRSFPEARAEVERIVGRPAVSKPSPIPSKSQIVATSDYTDERGQLQYQQVRYEPKKFRFRRPDGRGGWEWNLDGVQRVLFRLPELLKAEQVFVVEGEKDAGLLASWNLAATCNPGGAGKWLSGYAEPLRGKAVVILPDADAPGRRHALTVASSLLGVAAEVRIVELPGVNDVAEWAARDGSHESLMRLAGEAKPLDKRSLEGLRARWFPSDDAPERPRRLASLDALPGLWEVRAPEQPEVVKGLLGAGEVTLLAGKPGSGKSYVALGLALAVATGKPFCGRQTTQLRVLTLDKENSPQIIRQRVDHLGGRAIPSEDLCFWGSWCEFAPEIGDPLVAEFAKAGGLIIVDSAIRFFEGKSENDSAEIARFFRPIIQLARMGGTLLVICHTGKGPTAQDYRGSSDYAAAADASFKLDRDGPLGEPLTTFVLKVTKSRSGSARALRGRLTDSGFFGETSRPEPDGVSADDTPPDPDAICRRLEEAMVAKGVEHLTSHQAVEALDDYRITSPKQLATVLALLKISSKRTRIGGDQRAHIYTLDALAKAAPGPRGPDGSYPRGASGPATWDSGDNKGVTRKTDVSCPGTEKQRGPAARTLGGPGARSAQTAGAAALPEPQGLDFDDKHTVLVVKDDDASAKPRYSWKDL